MAQPVSSAPPGRQQGQIAANASLSEPIEIAGRMTGLRIPDAWDAAAATFSGSINGGQTWHDIYDIVSGTVTERTLSSTQMSALLGKHLALSLTDWLGYTHIRIRSGTAASPVTQTAIRTFITALAG